MRIENMFRRDIFRPINGVVKADQLDESSIWQELDEFVITHELDGHIRKFFSTYLDAIDRPNDPDINGRIGVWVSGFFGSGKSHFIKVLSYLLENAEHAHNGERKKAVEFFESKVEDAMLFADIKRAVDSNADVILFNIDSKADSRAGRDAILHVFLKVLNERQGYSPDHPHVAHMERYLESKGKLKTFHEAYRRLTGHDWRDERDAYEFNRDQVLEALSESLGQSQESCEKWVDNAENNFPLTVENFAKWTKEYLDSRGPDHKVVFLVDEIGQFIGGDTHLMLNLQTITEELGTICGGRAWAVVTSQEDIDAVLGQIKTVRNDFSKIQGRFLTRLSLSSANVDEVIQERLLAKEDAGTEELKALFAEKGDIIKNQLTFKNLGITFKSLRDPDEFALNYPFVPYQFKLLQKIFESIRKAGATGLHLAQGERSLLDAFQSAAKQVANEDTGVLVPLYRFYPAIESFLDTTVKRTIDHAVENSSLEAFDSDLLKVLFLVRYVDEMKGNVDNLVTLCVDRIDADRLALRRQIGESLQRLEKETLISRSGDIYQFLTNEERDISREIKTIDLNTSEEAKLLGDLIFEDVLKGQRKYRFLLNKMDFVFNRFCDLHPVGNRTEGALAVSMISPLCDDYELYQDNKCTLESTVEGGQVLVRLGNEESLGRELRTYLQTDKYVRTKDDGTLATGTKTILRHLADDNRERRERLIRLLSDLLSEADYFVAGNRFTQTKVAPDSVLFEALEYLVRNTFSKMSYLAHLNDEPAKEIQAILRANDIGQQTLEIQMPEANPDAINDLRQHIDLCTRASRPIVIHELITGRYELRPYGWPGMEVTLLLSRLLVLGEIHLTSGGAVVPHNKLYDTLTTPNLWRRTHIVQRKTADPAAIQKARGIAKDVFAQIAPDGEDALCTHLRDRLTGWQSDLQQWKTLADTGNYPGQQEIGEGLGIVKSLLGCEDSRKLVERFNEQEQDLREFADIDDETELLLPENLLHSDSLIRKLVREIPEESWQEIEVIGWIYQFYISEKKDQVIGKVVKSEDIPAATQLFTPNWIVKYLVQNSIGRQWLATYPDSPLRQQMEYYIQPAEQTPEVQAQLKAITPESLNPEEMTLLDPACGSGHILVEAYDLFKAFYQERGYRAKDIPRLILRNNLFGLEIDERAAQLASFALIMKARADDRRVLEGGIRMNIRCIQSSDGIKAEDVYEALTGVDVVDKSGLPPAEEFDFSEEQTAPLLAHLRKEASTSLTPSPQPLAPSSGPSPFSLNDIRTLLALFKGEDAQTFGSLIRIPKDLAKKLAGLVEQVDQLAHGDDLSRKSVAERFAPVAEQAWQLGRQYNAVVANPPYMGGKGMNGTLKTFAQKNYPDGKADLFAMFMLRGAELAGSTGYNAMVTMQSWMFLSSFENLRAGLLASTSLVSMAHLGPRAFDSIGGEVVQTTASILWNARLLAYSGTFVRLVGGSNEAEKADQLREAITNPNCGWFYRASAEDFKKIPGSPIAYWASRAILDAFRKGKRISQLYHIMCGLFTCNNELFIRNWWEVSFGKTNLGKTEKHPLWISHVKGAKGEKWYAESTDVIRYGDDGEEIRKYRLSRGQSRSLPGEAYYFQEGVSFPLVTSSYFSARSFGAKSTFDISANAAFQNEHSLRVLLALFCSRVSQSFLKVLCPTLNFTPGDLGKLPLLLETLEPFTDRIEDLVGECIDKTRIVSTYSESASTFSIHPLLLNPNKDNVTIKSNYFQLHAQLNQVTLVLQQLEEENNRIFVGAYGLHDEIAVDVPLQEITLSCNPHYVFDADDATEELEALRLANIMQELVSYAIGCMMGRYSLDAPGLIYAHSGGEGFDPSRYTTFPADPDGIIPLTDYAWFDDDATNRFVEFIAVAWPKEHLEENLDFVAESLSPKRGEHSRDTIRRYFASQFVKDHLQTYKRRPIYWLFSSGKERAFQCLVYLHRYNEGTLARMRTEYVIPLQGKMDARINHLDNDIVAAPSTAHGKKLQKERDTLRKQLEELRTFDEKLRHYADQRIHLDLDDGVKVNYGKFGDLLAEVKAVTGKSAEDA